MSLFELLFCLMVFVGSGSLSFDTDPDSGSCPTFDNFKGEGKAEDQVKYKYNRPWWA